MGNISILGQNLMLTGGSVILLKFIYETFYNIKDIDSQLKLLHSSNQTTPSSLFKNLQNDNFKKTFKQNNRNKDELIKEKMIITGYVHTSHPVNSKLIPNLQLIYQSVHEFELYSKTHFQQSDQIYCEQNCSPSFDLTEYQYFFPNSKCKVQGKVDISFDQIELIAQQKNFKKDFTKLDIFLLFLQSIMNTINDFKSNLIIFKGITIGSLQQEFGIKLGGVLSVLGDVIYNNKTQTIRIENPIMFIINKEKYCQKLKFNLKCNYAISFLSIIGFIWLSHILMDKYLHKFYNQSDKQQQQLRADFVLTRINQNFRCIVCNKNLRNIVTKPCLHIVVCGQCFDNAAIGECLECNQPIQSFVKIFVP